MSRLSYVYQGRAMYVNVTNMGKSGWEGLFNTHKPEQHVVEELQGVCKIFSAS